MKLTFDELVEIIYKSSLTGKVTITFAKEAANNILEREAAAQQSVRRTCAYCGGSGWKPGSHSGAGVKCGECSGTGASR